MPNPFTRTADASKKPNRNTFDLSFVNNLTTKFGQITPVFLKEVMTGDSFKIDATFGFNLQPMVFPVQSDIQANLHFFYVRNRALWDGWKDFITKTENKDGDSTPPYHLITEENRDMLNTGDILDYLGVPTQIFGRQYTYVSEQILSDNFIAHPWYLIDNSYFVMEDFSPINESWNPTLTELDAAYNEWSLLKGLPPRSESSDYSEPMIPTLVADVNPRVVKVIGTYVNQLYLAGVDYTPYIQFSNGFILLYDETNNKIVAGIVGVVNADGTSFTYSTARTLTDGDIGVTVSSSSFTFDNLNPRYTYKVISFKSGFWTTTGATAPSTFFDNYRILMNQTVDDTNVTVNNLDLFDIPYATSDNADGIRISALPARAVELVYNSFYRDDRNNPLIIDGKPYYNVFLENTAGGADTKRYKMYQRNWESDVFTSAVQSPQQGVLPLVGVTATGTMTFQDDEGKSYYMIAETADDGHTITGIKSYSSDMPTGTLRAMVDTISTGISINDFRNVNALQRWLETNMRKGLRYKDQLEAHFGYSPTYSELDMPEFIGGMSRNMSMNKVVQTSQSTDSSPLGSLAGMGTVLGDGGKSVECFCDEHGWIIGFLTFSPKPVYSQTLNKQLLKTQLLDYYFPEFAHIGYQPILNQEIAPLQATDTDGKRLTDVFGYQRAWYEYLSSLDEVHGDFRNSMRDYLIYRKFNGVPELGEDFLTISQDDANDVFAVQDDSDKIYGQIYFQVSAKRPIPAVGVPKLETE